MKPFSTLITEALKGPNKSKNYTRRGGNKQHFKWKVTLNNGKTKTVHADSRKRVKDSLDTNDLIIGIKKAVKVEE